MSACRVGLLYCFLTTGLLPVSAQSTDPDPTRWINYSQTYYKIPVAENGLYRITTAELQRAGVPVVQVDPMTVQLFHRGIEQAIYLEGEADHRFDAGDFLEFYGQKNNGALDSLLYRPHNAQPHTLYSLFSDTTAYFLTWRLNPSAGSGKSGKRMAAYTDTTYAGLTPEPYHWAEEVRLFTDSYPGWAAGLPQKIEYSYYEAGEGYTSLIQQKDKPFSTVFQLTNPVRTGPTPQLDVLVVGRDAPNHRVDVLTGPTSANLSLIDSIRFSGFTNARLQPYVPWLGVGADGRLFISTVSRGEATPTDDYSVSYIRIRYPQRLTANGQTMTLFQPEINGVGRSLLAIQDVLPGTRFWDISDPTAPVQIGYTTPVPGSVQLVVRETATARSMLSVSQPKTVASIQPVEFTNWQNRKPTYLIISHNALMQPVGNAQNPVRVYAGYRASAAGGGYDTLIATMPQLIDQYSYGERSPLAISRFARYLKNTLQYILMIGRSRSTPGIRQNPQQATLDMVMTAGFPGSDALFSAELTATEPNVPAIPTGRINAGTPQDVLNYLNKVKEYESQTNELLWRKNLLHLSGGRSLDELTVFRGLVGTYQNQAVGAALGARVTTLSKTTDNLVEQVNVAKPVNEGVGLMTFFGHSGLDATDLDIGFCSNDALGYRNAGKYPLLFVNGCAIGNFFFGRPTLATDWVLTPNRGAIAAIAQSHLGYTSEMHQYTEIFYTLLTDSTQLHKSIGHLQQETIRRVLAQTPDGRALANAQQMVLQGDPAIRLFPFTTPDYVLTAGGITISGEHGQPLTALSDSVQLRVVVQNAGQYWRGRLPVRVRRFVNGQESGVYTLTLPNSVAYRDTLTLTLPNDRRAEGQNQFDVTINPLGLNSTQSETNHANNQAISEINIADLKPVLIYPPDGGVISTPSIRLTAQYFGRGSHRFALELDSTIRFDSPFRQTKQLTATGNISIPTTLLNRPNTPYYWRVRLADTPNENWSTSSFVYSQNGVQIGLPEGQIQLAGALPTDNQQGDVVSIPVLFTNLSATPFQDSLVVRQTIYAAGLSNPQTLEWRVKAPQRTDTLRVTARIDTEKLPGLNRVVLTINPRLQPEYSFLNNTLDVPLLVQPDVVGPLLDVAVDGARITNGAVVSARPVIDVLVADENRSLIRRDTTGLDLFLQWPGKNAPFERLNWRVALAQPAGPDHVFRVRYSSPTLPEGTYQLLATARDAVGNAAVPYQVRFQVINEHRLTGLTVYPNPFREQTLFAFTLTGDTTPETATLTLSDLTGRVVRHLHPPIRIGLNEWAWDGRSDAGALLPAGEYIYKLDLSDAPDWPIADGVQEHLRGRILLVR